MEFYDHLLATELSNMGAEVGNLDASTSSVLMHSTPLNVMMMVEIFNKMGHNLPSVINTLQEPEIPSNEPITMPDNVVPTFTSNHLNIIKFIQSKYEEMVCEGRVDLKDEEIQIHGSLVWIHINVPGFLHILIQMVSEDIPHVVYAAWPEAAKHIANIIFQQYSADKQTN
ncbi:hypothetical protein BKA83DRAFT_4490573 [Pisolithus microcarpus]|nr:hypothetical protein BKA83DRAFT_4490573 [Pisolithus microcarpus]